MTDIEEFLEHYGVRGQKWGVRKAPESGAPRKTDREARKDAQETARAKQFYGEGAGTRRKLNKAKVEGKSKKDPDYAKAYEHHLSKQDTSKHASKAVSERKSIDRRTRFKQRAGYLARRVTGEMGTQAAVTAAVLAGGAYLASPHGRRMMSTGYNNILSVVNDQRSRRSHENFIRDFSKMMENAP